MYIVRKKRHKITGRTLVHRGSLYYNENTEKNIGKESGFIMGFIDEIKAKAKVVKQSFFQRAKTSELMRQREAILKEGTANPIPDRKAEEEIAKNKGDFDITGATIVDPATYEDRRICSNTC